MRIIVYLLLIIIFLPVELAIADTFVNAQTGQTFHGYATGNEITGLSDVNTTEKGLTKLNLNQFKVNRDRIGRNNTVAVISVSSEIILGMETRAFENALRDAASKGPLFILIEIDCPGGRIDLAIRMCSAIQKTTNCDIYAYITGGIWGGAYSGATAVSLACNKIFMAPGTVIGAATVITIDETGKPVELKKVLGDTIGEKMRSGWRNYLASLADNHNRPAALARAMENKDIEVVEVNENGKRVFVEAMNKKPDEKIVKTWSKAGMLLTLTANEAVECGMADKLYANRRGLLADFNAVSAQIISDTTMEEARKLYARIEKSLEKINASVDLGMKQYQATQSRGQAMKAMRSLMSDAQFVLGLKRKFGDDVPIDERKVQKFLNSVQAEYDALKTSP
jgi:membrane-bound ClpP family serine protease